MQAVTLQAVVGAVGTAAVAAWALRRWRRTADGGVQAASAVGVVGLGVMGSQLTLNLAEKLSAAKRSASRVSGFDLDEKKAQATRAAAALEGEHLRVDAFTSLAPFVASLSRPRVLLLLVPAGKAVEAAIEGLLPLLDKGDVIVDMGNEWFEATEARQARIAPTGVLYVGCGLSGGGEGARRGPCLMPGGPREAWELLQPLLEVCARATARAHAAQRGRGRVRHAPHTIATHTHHRHTHSIATAHSASPSHTRPRDRADATRATPASTIARRAWPHASMPRPASPRAAVRRASRACVTSDRAARATTSRWCTMASSTATCS